MSQHKKIESQAQAKEQFLSEVDFLIQPTNPTGKQIIRYLERLSVQSGIRNLDARSVMLDAVIAGIDSIDRNGTPIKNTVAWLKGVGARIVKNQVRLDIRDRHLKDKHKREPWSPDHLFRMMIAEEREFVVRAMNSLSSGDQEILMLRHIQGMKYQEIKEYYAYKENKSVSLIALRKRESRALERLKKQFNSDYNVYQ